MIKHRHHIIPRHMGGTDDEENLTPPISVEVHAAFHKQLWEDLGHIEDFIAWKALSGRITSEEARLAAAKAGQDKSIKYIESRSVLGHLLQKHATKESCSAGGKTASKSLVEWQKRNEAAFKQQCGKNARKGAVKRMIPHMYNGTTYNSKKELQDINNMCNTKFYRLLKRGDIQRMDKLIDAYA